MQGVYQIRNIINGKIYIGSSEDIRDRWHNHRSELRRGCHPNIHLQRSWNKNGKDNFVFMLLESTENLMEREQWYLDIVVDWGFDYNIGRYATSGMRGRTHTEEAKRKMCEIRKGTQQGKNNPFWGKRHTEKTKRKISEAQIGKVISEETRRKISKAQKGKTLSEKHKRKISETLTGRKHSEERKRKISKNHADFRGENHPGAKLTAEQVWDIHALYATGNYTQVQLSKRFRVCQSQMNYIVRGISWSQVYDKFHRR